jgi:hypothetical protein
MPTSAVLNYWTRYDIETGWDYGYVQVSADGSTWNTVESVTGYQGSWTQNSVDLSPYGGQSVYLRFALVADTWITEDGWYIDDIVLDGIPPLPPRPGAPIATAPAPGATVGTTPTLAVAAGAGPAPTSYGFVVYADAALSQLVASIDGITDVGGTAEWTTPVLADGEYWWRAYADDGSYRGDLSAASSFVVDGTTGVVVEGGFALRRLGGAEEMRFRVELPGSGELDLAIYNARGQRLRVLTDGYHAAGGHVLQWDGRDDHGRSAASGVYFVQARFGDQTRIARVVMVR